MNFYDWMIGKYYGKDTPRGDLAGDMKHEEDGFPQRRGQAEDTGLSGWDVRLR